MKFVFIMILLSVLGLCTAPFAQELHLINGNELLLDDFPIRVSGYRIQIGAFTDQDLAISLKQRCQSQFQQSAHIRFEDGFWKIRLGDFRDSSAALPLRDALETSGFPEAVLIPDQILVPAWEIPAPALTKGFRLQVEDLTDRDRATQRARDIAGLFPQLRVHLISEEGRYKIQMGDFHESAEAESCQYSIAGVGDVKPFVVPAQIWEVPPQAPEVSPPRDIFKYDD